MKKDAHLPSINDTAFECPHCGAYTTQYWHRTYTEQLKDNNTPLIPDEEWKEWMQKQLAKEERVIPAEPKHPALQWYDKMNTGLVFRDTKGSDMYADFIAGNLYLSECYNCKKITVWVHDNIVFPHKKQGVLPNQDLPENIIKDFEEARDIIGLSPRGAAALLRLCIQKLCVHLGEKGEHINDDIASLVTKGLDPLVQRALDIVRVIGNEAVHPGQVDLNDDRDTANKLFDLINAIADQMITHPKNVKELYEKLPKEKRNGIEKRNKKAKQ